MLKFVVLTLAILLGFLIAVVFFVPPASSMDTCMSTGYSHDTCFQELNR